MSVICEPKLGDREFKSFQKLIYDFAGISLADTKQVMVQGRLSRRLRELQLGSYSDYLELLQSKAGGEEATKFINALTTNKTAFFRESHHFDFLMNTVFPELRDRARDGGARKLRIWCSASSTGEEPYTLAMCVREFFGNSPDWDIRILASDIDTNVLENASQGIYRDDGVEDIPKTLLNRYFTGSKSSDEIRWQAKPILRELITFRRINLTLNNWAINTAFDVIFCRNVMIYFDSQTQQGLIERFADKMQPQGYLVIGHSESLFGISESFKPIGETVYRLTEQRQSRRATETARNPQAAEKKSPPMSSAPARRTPVPASVPLAVATAAKLPVAKAAPPVGNSSALSMSRSLNSALGTAERHPIIVGEVFASAEPVWVTTLLGSCVAACMYDERTRIGGMNHFMLPDSNHSSTDNASLGVHAMELLINEIMKLGGDRRRLKAKLFGGGAVVRSSDASWNVGTRNIEFAENFLEMEKIPLIASHTGGDSGMHVYFNSQTTKVIVRLLDSRATLSVQSDQQRQLKALATAQTTPQAVTLF
jgi:chemotaxis protein methyltransferase CheR